jgi:ribonuclease E
MKASTSTVYANISIAVATFLANEKRLEVSAIEARQNVKVMLIPNEDLHPSHFEVQREREQDVAKSETSEGYRLKVEKEPSRVAKDSNQAKINTETPLVSGIKHSKKKPRSREASKKGILSKILELLSNILFGKSKSKKATRTKRRSNPSRKGERSTRSNRRRSSKPDSKDNQRRPRSGNVDSAPKKSSRSDDENATNSRPKSTSRKPKNSSSARLDEKENPIVESIPVIETDQPVDDSTPLANVSEDRVADRTSAEENSKPNNGSDFSLTEEEQLRISNTSNEEVPKPIKMPAELSELTEISNSSLARGAEENKPKEEDPYIIENDNITQDQSTPSQEDETVAPVNYSYGSKPNEEEVIEPSILGNADETASREDLVDKTDDYDGEDDNDINGNR